MNDFRFTSAALPLGLALDERPLPHEKLDVFQVAIELVEHIAKLQISRGAFYAMLTRLAGSSAA